MRPGKIGTRIAGSLPSCTGRGANFVGDVAVESTKVDSEEKRELYTEPSQNNGFLASQADVTKPQIVR